MHLWPQSLIIVTVCFMVSPRTYNGVCNMFWILNLQSWKKVWDTFASLGRFPIHTGPTPSLTPQTMLDACIQNFFRVSTLYRVGGGRTARKFWKGYTVLRGNREMTEKYEFYSTVPRTFVQDCRLSPCQENQMTLPHCFFSYISCLLISVLNLKCYFLQIRRCKAWLLST